MFLGSRPVFTNAFAPPGRKTGYPEILYQQDPSDDEPRQLSDKPTIRPGDVTRNLERLGRQIGRVFLEPPDLERVRPVCLAQAPDRQQAAFGLRAHETFRRAA